MVWSGALPNFGTVSNFGRVPKFGVFQSSVQYRPTNIRFSVVSKFSTVLKSGTPVKSALQPLMVAEAVHVHLDRDGCLGRDSRNRLRRTPLGKQELGKQEKLDKIVSSKDDKISCYHWQGYSFAGIRAQALAWFIQFAIRADAIASEDAAKTPDSEQVQLSGLLEIHEKRGKLTELIRERHIIDEPALKTIGLTLYNFPTLSHFFVAPDQHGFVREVTVRELLEEIGYLDRVAGEIDAVKNSKRIDGVNLTRLRMVASMTPSEIEAASRKPASECLNEKFLVIDMAAPVTILKDQFLKALVRARRQNSISFEPLSRFGVLPYIDLKDWQSSTGLRVSDEALVDLLYADPDLGSKAKEETKRHVERMLDEDSPVSCGLRLAAAECFRQAIAFASEETELSKPEAEIAAEALDRWFPTSYPINLPDLNRYAEMDPEARPAIFSTLLTYEAMDKDLSIKERIQRRGASLQQNDGMLQALSALDEIES